MSDLEAKPNTDKAEKPADKMQPDHAITRHIAQGLPTGINASADSVSAPGDPDYEELCKLHNLQKPGDASTIFKRLIDGEWVVVDDLD